MLMTAIKTTSALLSNCSAGTWLKDYFQKLHLSSVCILIDNYLVVKRIMCDSFGDISSIRSSSIFIPQT